MSQIIKKLFHVKGMHCAGCEARIERVLSGLPGVKSVRASFSAGTALVEFDSDATGPEAFAKALAEEGYELEGARTPVPSPTVKTAEKTPKADKPMRIHQFIGILLVLFAVGFIISKTVGFNFIPAVTPAMGFGALFLVGLLTSLHCVAMCGGINLSQCISPMQANGGGAAEKVRPSILYNAGRVLSYTVIGGVVGALGSVVSFSGWARGLIAVLSGLFMVIMGVSMMGVFPWLNKITPRMPRFLSRKAGDARRGKGPFVVGLLNGLMPCGPLQAMQLYALGTGSFMKGALSMLVFSLGTVPLMFGLGTLSSMLSHRFTSRMLKVSAALVLLLGFVMVGRGLALSGVNILPSTGTQAQAQQSAPAVSGGVQTITAQITANGYPEITVQAGVPVKWILKANAADLNGCNGTLIIPKYNIEKKLQAGDNIIEFTPTETGTIPYSCWMGMITSRINVVAAGGKVAAATAGSTAAAAGSSSGSSLLSGGCCSAAALATKFAGGKIPVDDIQIAQVVNGVQEVTITVNDQGYSPAVAVVQKGVKTKIKFVAEKLNSCNSTVVFPDYNGGLDLSAGQLETPELTPTQDFTFECSMGMLHGYVKVVDDINKIDTAKIKEEVSQYKPATTGAGCCG